DLPGQEHMKNKGGTDGAGLCVFTSIEIACHWMNIEDLRGFQEKMTHEKGGGWPDKVDERIQEYSPDVQCVLHDAGASKTCVTTQERGTEGRMCGVTYGYSASYKSKISRMVDCVQLCVQTGCP